MFLTSGGGLFGGDLSLSCKAFEPTLSGQRGEGVHFIDGTMERKGKYMSKSESKNVSQARIPECAQTAGFDGETQFMVMLFRKAWTFGGEHRAVWKNT
jgi:hypothetical protein